MRKRALVFEDESMIRTLLSRMITRYDYEVFSYADPSESPLM